MIEVFTPVPPAITEIHGKTYVVPSWQEVAKGTTLDMISWQRPVFVSPTIITKHVSKYIITIYGDGRVTCDCPGYTFRRKCKHADAEPRGV